MDDIDLDELLEDFGNQEEQKRASLPQKKQEKIFNAFDDDDDFNDNNSGEDMDIGGYNPTVASDNRPPSRALSMQEQEKKAALFGLNRPNTAFTKLGANQSAAVVSNTSSLGQFQTQQKQQQPNYSATYSNPKPNTNTNNNRFERVDEDDLDNEFDVFNKNNKNLTAQNNEKPQSNIAIASNMPSQQQLSNYSKPVSLDNINQMPVAQSTAMPPDGGIPTIDFGGSKRRTMARPSTAAPPLAPQSSEFKQGDQQQQHQQFHSTSVGFNTAVNSSKNLKGKREEDEQEDPFGILGNNVGESSRRKPSLKEKQQQQLQQHQRQASQNDLSMASQGSNAKRLMKTHDTGYQGGDTLKDTPLTKSQHSLDGLPPYLQYPIHAQPQKLQEISFTEGGAQNQQQNAWQQPFQNKEQQQQAKQVQGNKTENQYNSGTLTQQDFRETQRFPGQFDAEFQRKMQEKNMEEFQAQINIIKESYDKQISAMNENFQKQLRYECEQKEQLSIEMNDLMKKEKLRLQEIHEAELKHREQLFEYEKQQIKRQAEAENQSLKRQLEQQAKLQLFNDELKLNADKLQAISNKIEHSIDDRQVTEKRSSNEDYSGIETQLKKREQLLNDMERKVKLEAENVEQLKIRLEKQRQQFEEQEMQSKKEMAQEKSTLRQEYNRLTMMQENLHKQEQQQKQDIQIKQEDVEKERIMVEQERIQLNEEFEQKYKDFEMQALLFEKIKKEFNDQQDRINLIHQQKLRELDNARDRLRVQESEVIKKEKALQLKEMEFAHVYQENERKSELLKIEKLDFDREAQKVSDMAGQVYSDNVQWQEFKRNFEQERDRLRQKEMELQMLEQKLTYQQTQMNEEKREVNNMQNTLYSLKRDMIKDIDNNYNSNNQIGNRTTQNPIRPPRPGTGTQQNLPQKTQQFNSTDNFRPKTLLQTFQDTKQQYSSQKQEMADQNIKYKNKQQQQQQQKQQQQQSVPKQNYDAFNLNGFLNSIKNLEEQTQQNQNYLNIEQDSLFLKQNGLNSYSNSQSKTNNQYGSSYGSSPLNMQKYSVSSSDQNY